MALRIYNSRTRRKDGVVPLRAGRVGVYVCGLTVYDHAHIGHARTAVSFEVVRRWLEHRFPGQVRFIQNVTDVDDKIIARAAETGRSPREHAAEWDARCAAQMARLGVRPPDEAPHVTQNIPSIIQFIQGILAKGFAYATPQGNVYFDVPGYDAHEAASHPGMGYGSLSNRDYREMAAGTRKDVEGDKKHPADFALWKAADAGEHVDAHWDSPWGPGRPGWHIECSLMATQALGDTIDVHGGGQDLIFPHHENEVAQSQAKTGKAPFVNTWMHSGFLNVEGEKMSKSLGNFITLESALDGLVAKGQGPEILRFYYVQTHYRSKIDYSAKGLDEAAAGWKRLQDLRSRLAEAGRVDGSASSANPGASGAAVASENLGTPSSRPTSSLGPLATAAKALEQQTENSLDDDLHTPGVVAALFDFLRTANRILDGASASPGEATAALASFERCGRFITLFDQPLAGGARAAPAKLLALCSAMGMPAGDGATEDQLMAKLLDLRAAIRRERDWAKSDKLRDQARAAGYILEDGPGGQRWKHA